MTSFTTLSNFLRIKEAFFLNKKGNFFDMWQVTGDMLQMTIDMWHVTSDTCHMTHSVGWTLSKKFSSLALLVWNWECVEHILTYWGDCRSAPATPGLLMICISILYCFSINWTKFYVITFLVQYEQCDHKNTILFLSLETK